jgi:hypothetical protein
LEKRIIELLSNSNQKALGARRSIEGIIKNSKDPIYFLSINEKSLQQALSVLSDSLGMSYLQVKIDLRDKNRYSWAGTAHEIREVLATMLRLLAPDDMVISQNWYKQEKDTSGPTQKQRVRYILEENKASSKEKEVGELAIKLDEMIGEIVRATYSRASDAAHRFKERNEVIKIVKYFEVFSNDLLNIEQ